MRPLMADECRIAIILFHLDVRRARPSRARVDTHFVAEILSNAKKYAKVHV